MAFDLISGNELDPVSLVFRRVGRWRRFVSHLREHDETRNFRAASGQCPRGWLAPSDESDVGSRQSARGGKMSPAGMGKSQKTENKAR